MEFYETEKQQFFRLMPPFFAGVLRVSRHENNGKHPKDTRSLLMLAYWYIVTIEPKAKKSCSLVHLYGVNLFLYHQITHTNTTKWKQTLNTNIGRQIFSVGQKTLTMCRHQIYLMYMLWRWCRWWWKRRVKRTSTDDLDTYQASVCARECLYISDVYIDYKLILFTFMFLARGAFTSACINVLHYTNFRPKCNWVNSTYKQKNFGNEMKLPMDKVFVYMSAGVLREP